MALQAGYYGVKRFLRDKLKTIAGTYDETIKSLFPRSEQAVLGARQWLDKSKAVADSGVLLEQVATGIRVYNTVAKSFAVVRIPCTLEINTDYRFKTDIEHTSGVGHVTIQYRDEGGNWGVLKDIPTDFTSDGSLNVIFNSGNHAYYRIALCSTRETSETGDVTYNNLMITLASDDTMAYSDYAMTNKELTNNASDQKTAINAIITAATGAADFAAFKTAMGAITPVTRSLSLTKEDKTEEVKEDIEPEKTVTKKRTTKKTEEV